MANWGTYGVLDALQAFDAANVLEYGEDRLFDDFRRSLEAHNAMVNDIFGSLVEFTQDRVRRYGIETRIEMLRVDEYGRMDAQKVPPSGVDIGFPLYPHQVSLQWTRKALEVMTVGEIVDRFAAVQRADLVAMRKAVQTALFKSTNNLTYVDRFLDNVTIPLRALLNADGAAIPEDDFGNTFTPGTHTHYLGNATLTAAFIQSLVDTVVEHGVSGPLMIYINRAQEAAVIGFTANFTPYVPPLLSPGGGTTTQVPTGGPLQPFDIYNRPIGVWNGAIEVWVKAWVPANYELVVELDPGKKPLAFRTRAGQAGRGALRLVAQDEQYPLRADTSEREFGVSVWGREQAAVGYSANATYAIPTIT